MKNYTHSAQKYLLLFSILLFSNYIFSQTTIYSENFQTGFGGWSVASTGSGTGQWLQGTDGASSGGANGNYMYSRRYSYNYNNNTQIIATSPTINLNGYTNITLNMDIWCRTEAYWDGMKIEYSLNNGSSWNNLGSVSNSNWYNDSDVDAFNNDEDGWSGNSSGWISRGLNLSVENSNFETSSQVKFRVLFASDGSQTARGVAFDEILIEGNLSNPAQEIEITSNGNIINDGDTSPSTVNNTNYGNVNFPGGSATNTFIIENLGGSNTLNLTGSSPYVTISGANAGDFTVTTIPSPTIAAGSSTSFAIKFSPSALGLRTATVTIANNDSDENPYNFSIQGTGITPPPCGSTVLGNYSYEANNQGWDTSHSYADRGNYGSSSYSGNFSIRLRANGQTVSPSFSLAEYDKVDLKFFFVADGMDSYETFYIEYRENNSASWQTVAPYRRTNGGSLNKDGDYVNNTFHSKTATIFKDDFTFPASATAQFRIRNGANSTSDYIYIDNITVTGTSFCYPTFAPGGVTSNLDLWLKANTIDGTTIAGDGTDVTFWADKGKGNNAEAVEDFMAPVYMHNVNRNINFNPVVEFQNDNETAWSDMTYIHNGRHELKGTGGFNSNDTFIVIFPDPTITTSMIPLDTFTSTDPTGNTYNEDVTGFGYGGYSARFIDERLTYCIGTTNETSDSNPHPSYDNGYGRADIGSSTNYNQTSIINFRHNASNSDMELYFNANQAGTLTNDLAKFAEIKNTRYWIGRSQYWDGSFDGRIAEIITYDSRKNDTDLTQERNRIQSYLAVKYGITLGVNGTSQDYVDSDGTVIWDVNTATPSEDVFNYDIAGIGRDDASELLQKQSRSVNNATSTHSHPNLNDTYRSQGVLTMGLTDVYDTNHDNISNNTTNFADKQFLMWGNDGVSLHDPAVIVDINMSSDITPALATWVQFNGIARTWKVVENGGDIPTVEVQILKDAVRTAAPPNGRYLMFISNMPNFGPTADYRIMTEDINELGEPVIKTNYDFDGTKYITFGWAPERIFTRSVYFDGALDYIDVEDNLDLDPSGFTISAWIKRDAADSGVKSIVSKRNTSFTSGYDLRIRDDNRIQIIWKNGSDQNLTGSTTIPDDEWHHVAVIYDGSQIYIYIDGVLDRNQAKTAPVATTNSFLIAAAGKGTITQHFRGNIDEVRVWNTALTEDQLRFVMNQEIEDNAGQVMGTQLPTSITKHDINAVPWSDLAGYYPMSVYTYTNTDDASGNGNQGALRNLDTVDRQTAPLPYVSTQNGDWDTNSTWTNGNIQYMPGTASIVNPSVTIDWNIVRTSHNVTMDNSSLPAGNNENRNVLGLYVDANELTLNGDNATNTGNGLTVSHYLSLTGKIDLEGESQLIQTEDSDLLVAVNGELEKDQQGTADTYTYNYWSAPVGSIDIATNNYRYTVQDVMYDNTNPVNFSSSGYDGAATNPIRIADYWIWKFANLTSGDYSAWQHVRRTGNILPGEGFTMKGPGTGSILTDQNYVFLGKPNNGDISLTINNGNDYLVGNPYASSLDADEFILDNPNTTGALMFWEHWGGGSHILQEYQGGYAIYNLSGGVPAPAPDPDVAQVGVGTKTPGRYVPVSQGFFVTGISTGPINFENDQRAFTKEGGSSSVFMRTTNSSNTQSNNEDADDRMKFRIGYRASNTLHLQRELLLTIDESATVGVDWAFDAHLNEDQTDDMFWMIGDEKFIIQANDNANLSTVYPLGVKTSIDGINSFTINALENVPNAVNIYLHDKALSIFHDLRVSDYEIFLTEGEYLDRFEITFKIMAGSLGIDDENITSLDVLYSNDKEKIVLINPNLVDVKSIELFNMLGQSVQKIESISESGYSEYDVKNLSTGTYVIKLYTVSGSVSTKKVLVK